MALISQPFRLSNYLTYHFIAIQVIDMYYFVFANCIFGGDWHLFHKSPMFIDTLCRPHGPKFEYRQDFSKIISVNG